MKGLIRDNPMIAVSVALPVVVVAVFALAQFAPRLYVDPPAHNLVLALDSGGIDEVEIPVRIDLSVADGALRAQVYPVENELRALARSVAYKPRLFEYLAATDTVREIEIELPDDVETLPAGTEIPIPELDGVELVTTMRAPDGYELELRPNRGGGLFRELFGAGGRDWRPRIGKDGAVIEIDLPLAQRYYYGGIRFIGWIGEGERE